MYVEPGNVKVVEMVVSRTGKGLTRDDPLSFQDIRGYARKRMQYGRIYTPLVSVIRLVGKMKTGPESYYSPDLSPFYPCLLP
jgi:hypothetical protein